MKKGFTLVEGLLILIVVLILGFGGYYFFAQQSSDTKNTNTQVDTQNQTDESSEDEPQSYTSKLYPTLSFDVPQGWSVQEPDEYSAEDSNFEGSVDGTILITKGDTVLTFDLNTIYATGFEGYTCYNHSEVVAVGDIYRFEDDEGAIVYQSGITESDEGWEDASSGDFSYSEDPNPNYCVNFPFIGTYSSTLNQSDYPDTPYGYTDEEKALVWLEASLDGTINSEILEEADKIILSLSPSVVDSF